MLQSVKMLNTLASHKLTKPLNIIYIQTKEHNNFTNLFFRSKTHCHATLRCPKGPSVTSASGAPHLTVLSTDVAPQCHLERHNVAGTSRFKWLIGGLHRTWRETLFTHSTFPSVLSHIFGFSILEGTVEWSS